MAAHEPFTFPDKPPCLEGVEPGSYPAQAFLVGSDKEPNWPTHPPGIPEQAQDAIGTVDDADPYLGKRDGGGEYHSLDGSGLQARNEYDELYEDPDKKNFESLGLPSKLTEGLYSNMGFEKPSRIQALTLPKICNPPYISLVAQAQNGCGKTCCFAVCILTRVDTSLDDSPQAMVLVPTRELAIQNASVIEKMGQVMNVSVISTAETDRLHAEAERLYAQGDNLFIRNHVIVGTHGSLRIFRRKSWLSFHNLKVVVLDEADHMIDREGFRDDTTLMMRHVDNETKHAHGEVPQLLMFSATYREDIKEFAHKLFKLEGRESQQIWIEKERLNLDKIKQVKVECWGYNDKIDILRYCILPNCEKMGKSIIFVRFREAAKELHEYLTAMEWPVTAISGAMDYADRDRVIEEFRKSVTNVLISTDVLSRGFDVSDVSLVVNFDIPVTKDGSEPAYETYLHRVGRTGRFKRRGAAFNFMNMQRPESPWFMQQIEHYFGKEIPVLDARDDHTLNTFLHKAGLTEYQQDS